jgi:hypothetical protein
MVRPAFEGKAPGTVAFKERQIVAGDEFFKAVPGKGFQFTGFFTQYPGEANSVRGAFPRFRRKRGCFRPGKIKIPAMVFRRRRVHFRSGAYQNFPPPLACGQ